MLGPSEGEGENVKRRSRFGVLFAVVAATAGMAACNSSSNSALTPCVPPTGVTTVLVYPAPGSTGIPDNFGQVVLGSSGTGLPSSFQAVVFDTTGGMSGFTFNLVTPAASPLPTPAATPAFSNPLYQSSSSTDLYPWPQGHTLSVYLNDQSNQSCTPQTSLGSFTVQ
jgi:hypothetical protein